jgi:integrase
VLREAWRVGFPLEESVRLISSANAPLDTINGELTSEFAAQRIEQGKQIATVNSSLRVLRRVLNLAVEWGVITVAPKLKVLSGERRRERVVTAEEEAKYLTVSSEPLGSIATVLAHTGMRPEESFRMRWEYVTWLNGRNGALLVTHGKTASARRVLPMTPRVRAILETRWLAAGKPGRGLGMARWNLERPPWNRTAFLWPAPQGAQSEQGAPVRSLLTRCSIRS